MTEIAADALEAPAKPTPMRTVVAASAAGTAFEWYDFFVFGSLLTIISRNFFAELGATAGQIAALALFGVGFAFRPLASQAAAPRIRKSAVLPSRRADWL